MWQMSLLTELEDSAIGHCYKQVTPDGAKAIQPSIAFKKMFCS